MVLRRSIRMVVPRSLSWPGRCFRGAGCYFLERTPRTEVVALDPAIRSSAGGPGLFLSAANGANDRLPPARSGTRPFRVLHGHDSTPQLIDLSRFPARFSRPNRPEFRDRKARTRASTGRRSGHFGTLLGATGGTQTHSRRTGRKLGQLLDARQGLVRVPESNTKYGGKRRKTGGEPTPALGPSISESSGIPKRKNCSWAVDSGCVPLFTGQLFIALPGLRFGDSRKATESAGLVSPPAGGKGSGLAARCRRILSRPIPTHDRIKAAARAGGPRPRA